MPLEIAPATFMKPYLCVRIHVTSVNLYANQPGELGMFMGKNHKNPEQGNGGRSPFSISNKCLRSTYYF